MLSRERKGRVTASIMGAILGFGFKSRMATLEDKVLEFFDKLPELNNKAVNYGKNNELIAIENFNQTLPAFDESIKIKPNSDSFLFSNWLLATPDGFTNDGWVAEVKCPLYKKGLTLQGELKDLNYYAQVQTQMLALDTTKAVFIVYEQNKKTRYEIIEADYEFQSLTTLEGYKFYKELQAILKDPAKVEKILNKHIFKPLGDIFYAAEQKLKEIQETKKQLELDEKTIKESFVEEAKKQDANLKGSLFSVRQQSRQSLDYKKFLLDNKLSVDDKYKKETSYFVVS